MSEPISELRSVTCHMRSHSVTCHPTEVNAPRLNPSQISRYSIYLPRRHGRLSWPMIWCHWFLFNGPIFPNSSRFETFFRICESPNLNYCNRTPTGKQKNQSTSEWQFYAIDIARYNPEWLPFSFTRAYLLKLSITNADNATETPCYDYSTREIFLNQKRIYTRCRQWFLSNCNKKLQTVYGNKKVMSANVLIWKYPHLNV